MKYNTFLSDIDGALHEVTCCVTETDSGISIRDIVLLDKFENTKTYRHPQDMTRSGRFYWVDLYRFMEECFDLIEEKMNITL